MQPYGNSVTTCEQEPQQEQAPQQLAAQAAHALRAALADLGLLERVPECRAEVQDGKAVVRLGTVDAAAAVALAARLAKRRRRQ